MILKALCCTRSYTWLLLRFMQNQELYPLLAKLGGDLNVQIKGPGKLRLSFFPNLILPRPEFAETTNLINFFLCVQQRDFDGS